MVEKRRICPFTPAQAEPSPSQSLPDRRPKKKVTLNLSVESMDDVRNLVVRLNHNRMFGQIVSAAATALTEPSTRPTLCGLRGQLWR